MMNDLLNESSLQAALGECAEGLCISVLPSCPSTNALAKQLLCKGETRRTLIVAEEQTAGCGRMGRSFYSPPKSGVYFSLLLPGKAAFGIPAVTCRAAVAVMRAVKESTGEQTDIKWVNDLQRNGKKICGILAEGVLDETHSGLVLGIGINLRPASFPPELADIAASLENETLSRCQLIAAVIRELLGLLQDFAEWLQDYRQHSCVLGKRITWTRGEERGEGIATKIDAEGRLTVEASNGETVILGSGEISLRLS